MPTRSATPVRIAVTTVLATCVAAAFVVANVVMADASDGGSGVPYVRLYDPPADRLQVIVNQGDGQAFAALAQDPLLRRPEVFSPGPAEAAYRAQRPLLGWLTWAASAGQAALVPLVLILWSVVGFAALAGVLAWLLIGRGVPPSWAFFALLTPGALVTLDWTGPECFGTAAALAGVGLWCEGRRSWALVALVCACLFRESFLLVPVAMVGHGLVVGRQRWQSLVALGLPIAAYAAWVSVVWLRLGQLPSDAGEAKVSLPFVGLAEGWSDWNGADLGSAGLLLLAGGATVVVGRRDALGWVAGFFMAASIAFGPSVWAQVEDFSRVLLPVVASAVLVLVPHRGTRRTEGPVGSPR